MVQRGQITYDIGFQREDGKYQTLLVSDNGQILREQMFDNASAATGSAATTQTGVASSSTTNTSPASQYSFVTSPVPLSNPEDMLRTNMPGVVQNAVRQQVGDDAVKSVRRGEWRGRTVYQVGFTDSNNRYVELQLDEKGQVIYDPRGAQSSSTSGNNFLNNLGRAIFDGNQK